MSDLVSNKKAKFDFNFISSFDAGVSLLGYEVKALRNGKGSLSGSYVIIRGKEAFIVGMDIPPYQPKNTPEGYDSRRLRRLLLNRKEISELIGHEKAKGESIIPKRVFLKNNKIKIELGIAKGKKKFDKRETIKKRETDRNINRILKDR